jgi:carnosine N-methyltransferase
MLLASDFILNGCAIPDTDDIEVPRYRQFNISPWIAETKNVTSFESRIKRVVVPDVDPSSIQNIYSGDGMQQSEFSMLAGEFLSLYASFLPHNIVNCECDSDADSHQKFHGIVCSFFLDTAPSLPEYLITIYHMLADDGLLLHFGPLLYHWSGHGALLPSDLDGGFSINDLHGRYQKRNAYLDVSSQPLSFAPILIKTYLISF